MVGSAAILAAVSGILPETLRVHGWVFEMGVLPQKRIWRDAKFCSQDVGAPRGYGPSPKDTEIESQREESVLPASHQYSAT